MKYLTVLCALALFGCEPQHHSTIEKEQRYIHYYKDARTNTCYAGHALGAYSAVLTAVPCTPDVEKLTEAWPEYYQ